MNFSRKEERIKTQTERSPLVCLPCYRKSTTGTAKSLTFDGNWFHNPGNNFPIHSLSCASLQKEKKENKIFGIFLPSFTCGEIEHFAKYLRRGNNFAQFSRVRFPCLIISLFSNLGGKEEHLDKDFMACLPDCT